MSGDDRADDESVPDGSATTDLPPPEERAEPTFDEDEREPDDTPVDDLFEVVDVEGDVRVVSDRTCHGCRFFADPPDLACTHPGTEIRRVVDSERFEVVDCPMVSPEIDIVDRADAAADGEPGGTEDAAGTEDAPAGSADDVEPDTGLIDIREADGDEADEPASDETRDGSATDTDADDLATETTDGVEANDDTADGTASADERSPETSNEARSADDEAGATVSDRAMDAADGTDAATPDAADDERGPDDTSVEPDEIAWGDADEAVADDEGDGSSADTDEEADDGDKAIDPSEITWGDDEDTSDEDDFSIDWANDEE